MLEINIHIHRPLRILAILGGTVSLFLGLQWIVDSGELPVGGPLSASVQTAESTIQRERQEIAVIERREEILRYQLSVLENEKNKYGKDWSENQKKEWQNARNKLLRLLEDRRVSEEYIRTALFEIKSAEITALAASGDPSIPLKLSWPVEPKEGISALFHDEEYKKRFGLVHEAIDIPVLQNSEVRSAAEGVVEVLYKGDSGYQYIIIAHPGGATLYGHVSEFLVREGQVVHRGDVIALSGGRPGSLGAGPLSTGPHLHFEVVRGEAQMDPLDYLPKY